MKEFIVDSYSMISVLATNNAMLVMLVVLLSLIGYKLSKFMGLIKNLVGLGFSWGLYIICQSTID
jgi:Ni/Fe-hydrogenase subunit HybB-like protein